MPATSAGSTSALAVALRKIIDRLSDAERTRLRNPMDDTISKMEQFIIENPTLSNQQRVMYIGYALEAFIEKYQQDGNDGFLCFAFLINFSGLQYRLRANRSVGLSLRPGAAPKHPEPGEGSANYPEEKLTFKSA